MPFLWAEDMLWMSSFLSSSHMSPDIRGIMPVDLGQGGLALAVASDNGSNLPDAASKSIWLSETGLHKHLSYELRIYP